MAWLLCAGGSRGSGGGGGGGGSGGRVIPLGSAAPGLACVGW